MYQELESQFPVASSDLFISRYGTPNYKFFSQWIYILRYKLIACAHSGLCSLRAVYRKPQLARVMFKNFRLLSSFCFVCFMGFLMS